MCWNFTFFQPCQKTNCRSLCLGCVSGSICIVLPLLPSLLALFTLLLPPSPRLASPSVPLISPILSVEFVCVFHFHALMLGGEWALPIHVLLGALRRFSWSDSSLVRSQTSEMASFDPQYSWSVACFLHARVRSPFQSHAFEAQAQVRHKIT